jgi:hypothetical protein
MPATARKTNFNSVSKSRQKMIAAVQIEYKRANPYLEDKDEQRAARLDFITKLLNLRRPCESITELSDQQLGIVLDELRRQSGQAQPTQSNTNLRFLQKSENSYSGESEVIHLATKAQVFTLEKLVEFIGWTEEQRTSFMQKRFRCAKFAMLTFKKATSVTNILLRIAAQKDLKQRGKTTCTTAEINRQIEVVKTKLQIDQNK